MKQLIYLLIMLAFGMNTKAQYKRQGHKKSLIGEVGGGLSSFVVKSDIITGKEQFGLWGALLFEYPLGNKGWYLSSGLGLSRYGASLGLKDYKGSLQGRDADGDYEFRITAQNLHEEIEVSMLELPFSFKYKHIYSRKGHGWYGESGLKASWAVASNYRLERGTVTTTLYYPEWNVNIHNVPEWGLYNEREGWHPEGHLDTKMMYSLFFKGGLFFFLNNRFFIAPSLYFSYGLNHLTNKNQVLMPEAEAYNSLSTMVDEFKTMQVGMSVSIRYLLM